MSAELRSSRQWSVPVLADDEDRVASASAGVATYPGDGPAEGGPNAPAGPGEHPVLDRMVRRAALSIEISMLADHLCHHDREHAERLRFLAAEVGRL